MTHVHFLESELHFFGYSSRALRKSDWLSAHLTSKGKTCRYRQICTWPPARPSPVAYQVSIEILIKNPLLSCEIATLRDSKPTTMAASSTLLRVAPFLATTSSVTFTVCSDLFLRPLIPEPGKPSLRSHVNRTLPMHGRFIWRAVPVLASIYAVNIGTAVVNLTRSSDTAKTFYAAGLSFTLLHFLWGRRAMHLLWTIRNDINIEDDEGKDNVAAIVAWVHLNVTRAICSDLPGWVCYFLAFMTAEV